MTEQEGFVLQGMTDPGFVPDGDEKVVENCQKDLFFRGELIYLDRVVECPVLRKKIKINGHMCQGPIDNTKCEHNHF